MQGMTLKILYFRERSTLLSYHVVAFVECLVVGEGALNCP